MYKRQVNSYIRQLIAKGFAIYIYDYKFDDLSTIAYNSLLKNMVYRIFCVRSSGRKTSEGGFLFSRPVDRTYDAGIEAIL